MHSAFGGLFFRRAGLSFSPPAIISCHCTVYIVTKKTALCFLVHYVARRADRLGGRGRVREDPPLLPAGIGPHEGKVLLAVSYAAP